MLTLPYPYPYPHNPSSLLVPLVPQSPSAPTAARLRELKSSLVARGASKPPSPAARTDTPMGSTLERSTPERQQRCAVPGVVQRGVSRLLQVARRLSKPVGRMLPALPTCSGRTALLALAATLGCAAVAAAAVQGPSHVLASMAALSGQVCFVYERLVYIVGRADLGFRVTLHLHLSKCTLSETRVQRGRESVWCTNTLIPALLIIARTPSSLTLPHSVRCGEKSARRQPHCLRTLVRRVGASG